MPEQAARERRRGRVPEPVAGQRRRGRVPEPVVGQRRRGRAQVPHMRLHRIRPVSYTHLSRRSSICPFFFCPRMLPLCLSLCLPFHLPVCPQLCLSVCPPFHPPVCLQLRLPVCLQLRPPVCPQLRLSFSIIFPTLPQAVPAPCSLREKSASIWKHPASRPVPSVRQLSLIHISPTALRFQKPQKYAAISRRRWHMFPRIKPCLPARPSVRNYCPEMPTALLHSAILQIPQNRRF